MKTLIIFLLSTAFSFGAVVLNYFTPIGSTENLVAKFDHSIEATTTTPYNGYVLVNISGYGYDNPSETYDAFYRFDSGNNFEPYFSAKAHRIAFGGTIAIQYYGGGIIIDQNSYHIGDNTPYSSLNDLSSSLFRIVFNEDVGIYDGINYYGKPEYKESHEYNYVLFVNNTIPKILNFGFGDTGLLDNSGQYNISITPVTPIPEPSVFLCLGVSVLFFRRQR